MRAASSGAELACERLVIEHRAARRVAEHELVVALEGGPAAMLPERLGQRGGRTLSPSSDFDSRTRSTLSTRSTSRQRSPSAEAPHAGRTFPLPYPMVRRKGEQGFRRVSRGEALDLIAERIRATSPDCSAST